MPGENDFAIGYPTLQPRRTSRIPFVDTVILQAFMRTSECDGFCYLPKHAVFLLRSDCIGPAVVCICG